MTRKSVRRAIEFQGVIEGCPDHQWLLTDALYDAGKTPPSDSDPRWIVLSHHQCPSTPPPDAGPNQQYYQVRDLEEGWSMSAASASDLANQIRRHFSASASNNGHARS
jgi:hypothetical protein